MTVDLLAPGMAFAAMQTGECSVLISICYKMVRKELSCRLMVKLTGSRQQVSRWQYWTAALMSISQLHLSPIHSPFAALRSIPVNPLNCLWPISLYPKWKCSPTGSVTPAWKYLQMADCIDTRACRVISPGTSESMRMAWLWIIRGYSKGYELHQFCIPNKFPLSYLLKPSEKIPTATVTISAVKPTIPPSNSQVNCLSNCRGTNEMNPAGMMVKSRSRTVPLKMCIG